MIDTKENLKILVHSPNWVGDHVMAFHFYHTLNEIFPNSEKHILGRSWVNSLLPEKIFTEAFTIKKKLQNSQLKKLQENKYDIGITLSPSFRSAWMLKQSKIPLRLGYKTDFRSCILSEKSIPKSMKIPPLNIHEHRALSFMRLLTPFFESSKIAEDYFYSTQNSISKLSFSNVELKSLLSLCTKKNIQKKTYWIICPGSVATSKIYPIDYLVPIVNECCQKNKNLHFLLIGSHIEKEYAKQLLSRIDKAHKKQIIDITTLTNLKELIYFIQNARGVIANDSGIAHITSLTKTPLVTFIGMARKEETLTLSKNKIVLNKNIFCSPCMKQKCALKKEPLKCLVDIKPIEVLTAMKSLDKKLL